MDDAFPEGIATAARSSRSALQNHEARGIECGEERVGRAAVAIRSGSFLPAFTVLGEGVDAGRLGREEAGSAVVDDLGIGTKAALAESGRLRW